MRLYVTGRICLEGEVLVRERELPGRQGRVALALLAVERNRAVTRDELAAVLWPTRLAESWEVALSAVVSKLRGALRRADPSGGASITSEPRGHQLILPTSGWVDIEEAAISLDVAEAALRDGDLERAWTNATVAQAIARRGFLAGEDEQWVQAVRTHLRDLHLRALLCLAEVWRRRGEVGPAAKVAEEVVTLDPFREAGHRSVIRAYAAAGDRAAALRAYERCRRLLDEELGATPSPETERLYEEVLRA